MSNHGPAPTICCLWHPNGPNSIQEFLESAEYKNLLAAGLGAARIWVPFPIDSRFRDPDGQAEIFFCRPPKFWNKVLAGTTPESYLLYVPPGLEMPAGFLPDLLVWLAVTNPDVATYSTVIADGERRHLANGTLSPWNTLVSGRLLRENGEELRRFHELGPLSGPIRNARIGSYPGPTVHVVGPRTEKEYRAWSGTELTLDELEPHLARSPRLLSAYVEQLIALGRPQPLESLPHAWFETCPAVNAHPELAYHDLGILENLLAKENWPDLLQEASRFLERPRRPETLLRIMLYRAVALANLEQISDAIADIKICLNAQPRVEVAQLIAGRLLLALGQAQEAVQLLGGFAQNHQQDFPALKLLAQAHYAAGDFQAAMKLLVYMLHVFDFDDRILSFLFHAAFMAGDMATLRKYYRYIDPYPPLPFDFPEKEWLLVHEHLRHLPMEAWAVDVGANVGEVSRILLSWGRRCLSIEPAKDTFARLKANLAPYESASVLFQGACSSHGGRGRLRMGLTNGFNTLDPTAQERLSFRYGEKAKFENVKLATLSELIARFSVDRVGLLKLDVEGHELEVLKGLTERDYARMDLVFLEIDLRLKDNTMKSINHLMNNGFHYGLIFQHPNQDLGSFNIFRIHAHQEVTLHGDQGVYGNALLSKKPLFSHALDEFPSARTRIPTETVRGRLLP